jgi:hypothetical protein
MKKIIFTAAILISCLSFKLAGAQVHVSLGLNIGAQPEWGPVGYDHVDYYYIPDVDAYYDVPAHQYVYYHNNAWIHAAYLPGPYRDYDMYHGYKVVVNQPNPWFHHADIRARYAGYRGRRDQVIIRDSHDERYRNHWHGDNGRHNGWDKHGDKGHDHGDNGHGHDEGGHGHDRGN